MFQNTAEKVLINMARYSFPAFLASREIIDSKGKQKRRKLLFRFLTSDIIIIFGRSTLLICISFFFFSTSARSLATLSKVLRVRGSFYCPA